VLRDTAARPWALWSVFVIVHAWLWVLNLTGPGFPLGDVEWAYLPWVEQGLSSGDWRGIDTAWVYPYVALAPMLLAYLAGPEAYAEGWLTLVTVLNAAALLCLSGTGARVRLAAAAWWWMLFLALLGPIAFGRIDSITAALAVAAVTLLERRPGIAAALLAVGAWIKIWPGALLLAAAVVSRQRAAVIGVTAALSTLVVVGGLALGGGAELLSPITEQVGRGLQVEAVVTTPWLWAALAGGQSAAVYYDDTLFTFQVTGDGVDAVAAAMTPLLAVAVATLVLLAVVAHHRGAEPIRLLPVLSLALVAALVVVNKVGSPQFAVWLAAPIVLGLLMHHRRGVPFAVPAALALAIVTLTQVIYPVLYGQLLSLQPAMLVVISVRNALWAVLLGWAVFHLIRLVREPHTGARDRLGAPPRQLGASS